jgi:hypothetical protein
MDDVNPDISNHVNPMATHTSQIGFSSKSVGGKRRRTRRYKSRRSRTRISSKSKKTRRFKRSRRHRLRRHRLRRHRTRKQHGGVNPTYRTFSTSLEPGHNGIYANGPSVGKIIEKYD